MKRIRASPSSLPPIYNPFGIQLLPKELQELLFGKTSHSTCLEATDIAKARQHLRACGLETDHNESQSLKIPSFDFPLLEGSNVSEHFKNIAERKVSPYLESFKALYSESSKPIERPRDWAFQPGWTRYNNVDNSSMSCLGPDEDCLAFDVEVLVKEGHAPILATALSHGHWYSWCSPALFSTQTHPRLNVIKPSQLISFPKAPKIIIGHNVAYDRARILEEYQLDQPGRTRFLDTMSLHITVSGMTTEQRALKAKNNNDTHANIESLSEWMNVTSNNNLADVYKLYCPGERPLRKSVRDVFVHGTIEDVRKDFQNLLSYCSEDTEATLSLSKILMDLFLNRCPHPAALFGLLEFGKTYLPIDDSWFEYIRQSDTVADELSEEVKQILEQHARESCQLLNKDSYKVDPWLWDYDWERSALKMKKRKECQPVELGDDGKNLSAKFKPLLDTRKLLHKSQPRAPGYPSWFQEICSGNRYENWYNRMVELTPGKSLTPQLLRLSWKGLPLHRHVTEKWGFIYRDKRNNTLEPKEDLASRIPAYSPQLSEEKRLHLQEGISFTPLPHKDGIGKKVGNPLSKDFMDKVSDGTLATHSPFTKLAHQVLSFAKTMSYWKSNRDRIISQMIGSDALTSGLAILPQSVASGTITRRSVEKTWLTASNAKVDRIGSELKTLIRAPEGYHIVGADVDSQELWIAAVLGDASFVKEHGCTAMGWMTLQGNKNDGTDMHSKTAGVAGVTRDQAKILNYGRIYGAGLKFAKMLLKKFNPSLDNTQASSSAKEMYDATKGQRMYSLNELGAALFCAIRSEASETTHECIGRRVTEGQTRELAKVNIMTKDFLSLSRDKLTWELTLKGQSYFKSSSPSLSLEDGISLIRHLFALKPLRSYSNFSSMEEIVSGSKWEGGSESYTFNRLEEIILSPEAKTPVLKNSISRVLEAESVGKDFLTSRINWVVQSSGVDYMHLLILAMDWLMGDVYGLESEFRFLICIHDEVRYVVRSEHRYRAAYCLHLANLMVRAVFVQQLGMDNLPLGVAFFSGVDVDKVMRKEPSSECVTPSNPMGLYLGYGISPGETLTFEEVLEKL